MSFLGTRKYSPELPDVFSDKMEAYFTEDNLPWTMTDLCLHMKLSYETFTEYAKIPQFSESIRQAKMMIENYSSKQLFRKENVTGIIFSLKNNFNWKDKIELDSNNTNNNNNVNVNTDVSHLSPEERERQIEELLAKRKKKQ